jgi:hypothetical protein
MTENEAKVIAELQIGVLTVIVHIFNTLHRQGVLPLSDAITSLEATAQGLPANVSEVSRNVIRSVISGLQSASGSPPPSPLRH